MIGVPLTYAAFDHRTFYLVVLVLAAIIRLSIAWVVRRRAARLDEDSALAPRQTYHTRSDGRPSTKSR